MSGKHCRLYDENLVHNIMVSTGLSILDYVKQNREASSEEICEFVEVNASHIIDDTIDHLNDLDGLQDKEADETDDENEHWPFEDEDSNPQPPGL